VPFEDGLHIIQDEQAPSGAQGINQQGDAFPDALWQIDLLLLGEERDALGQLILKAFTSEQPEWGR
jgi:hypothetical protein